MGPKRDWRSVRTEASDPCRVCGREGQTERAHISGPRYDRPRPGTKTLWVNPLDIVPLCRPHHLTFDAGELDVQAYLTPAEQVRAVEVMGGIESARIRLSPTAYRKVAT